MSDKVIQIADHTGNCMSISHEQIIKEFQEFLEENQDFDKVMLIALNTNDGRFETHWRKSKMINSEGITALSLVIDDFIGYLKED